MDDGRLIHAGPKSRAGTRAVAFPPEIVPELRWHLECFAQGEKDGGLVFVGPLGGRLRRSNFRRFWHKARDAIGLPQLHFHDLRHTGNTMAAAQGARLRELMERMGHSKYPCRADLPARHQRAGPGHRRGHGQAAQRRAEDGQAARSIGHATGRRPEKRVLKLARRWPIMPLTCAETMRTGDGNRTRMTSLEGSGPSAPDEAERRPGAVPPAREGPRATVVHRPIRARNGHGCTR